MRNFPIDGARFDVIIHAATDVVVQASPHDVFTTCLDGTTRVLALARTCGASRMLLLSSGAIYGPLPFGMTHVPENHLGGPDPLLPDSAYGEGKRVAEWLATHTAYGDLTVCIARLFAVVGPHLPLNKHFAIGNFLRAAMAGEEIVIQGNGKPHRSYLYAADMAAWLWAVLLRGRAGRAYNVGSDASISIGALADRVCQVLGVEPRVRVLQATLPDTPVPRYVPNIARARTELGLPPPLALDEAISRTARWHAERAGVGAGGAY